MDLNPPSKDELGKEISPLPSDENSAQSTPVSDTLSREPSQAMLDMDLQNYDVLNGYLSLSYLVCSNLLRRHRKLVQKLMFPN